jgi:hypothetical protein
MRTTFWRFAYDDELLEMIMASDKLYFPDLKRWPLAKNNTEEKIISALREGHFILLANFDLTSGIGTVRGVGKITAINDGQPAVLWKKPVPRLELTPDIQGGVKEWRGEGVFCFDAQPAKRYKLDAHTKKLFNHGYAR